MKHLLSFCFFIIIYPSLFGQVQFTNRLEFEAEFGANNFMTSFYKDGIIGFRTTKEKAFSSKLNFEMFQADFDLNRGPLKKIAVRDNHDMAGFDLDDGVFYVLFQKRNSTSGEDKYIVEINLENDQLKEYNLSNVLDMELKEFYVMEEKVIFMGISESLPVVQLFDLKTSNIFTAQGIYSKNTEILQLRKDHQLGVLDVLISKRNQYKVKEVSVLTFDMEGNKLREVNIDRLDDPKLEIIEGILTPFQEYSQSLVGTFGKQRQEAYQGIYLIDINEFGESTKRYYTLEDFPNFFNYLTEKQQEKKIKALEKSLEKGKTPDIKPTFSTREVVTLGNGHLIYSDLFTANNPRYYPRDGVYANNMYRMGQFSPMYNSMMFNDPYFLRGMPYGPSMNNYREGEYKFHAAHLLLIDMNGNIIWDNSLKLPGRTTSNPGKFGEISYVDEKLHFLYIEDDKLSMSYLYDGELIFENETFEIGLINENERIKENDKSSLMLYWWYDNFYILSGKQTIRFQDEEKRQSSRDVFFITKIAVNGALFDPEKED
ncbi:transcriptional regulator [Belliella sp. R4-6]|uniref:Transcriptional regulator n=1 Tax=Belliella alkalica TaxID=1730871 RepID=A0ABS9VGP9_9BACT|nr:transcriptional regulator [Belliella alkalica]MCH7415611.1 transcriptional regulator [Belliella alkalica]